MPPEEAARRQQDTYLRLVVEMVVRCKMDLPTARVIARARAQAQREAEEAAERAVLAAQQQAMRPTNDTLAPRKRAKKERQK